MSRPTWILGAPDPEMAAIEALLRELGPADDLRIASEYHGCDDVDGECDDCKATSESAVLR